MSVIPPASDKQRGRLQRQECTDKQVLSLLARVDFWFAALLIVYLAAHGVFSFFGHSADATAIVDDNHTADHLLWFLFELFSFCFIVKYSPGISRRMRFNIASILFPILSALSILWTQDLFLTSYHSIGLITTTLLAFALVSAYKFDEFLVLIEVTGFCLTIIGLSLFVFVPGVGQDHYADAGALQGMFLGKNVCAMQTVFLMSPLFIFRKGSFIQNLFRSAYWVFGVTSMLLTRSRTGIGLMLVLLLFAFTIKIIGKVKGTDRAFTLLGVFTFISFVLVGITFNAEKLLRLTNRDLSLTGRTEIWSVLWVSVMKRPLLGYGYGAFWTYMHGEATNVHLAMHWVFSYAHNGFLEVWLQLGALGLFFILLQAFIALKNGVVAFQRSRQNSVDWSILIVLISLLYNIDESFLGAGNQLPWMIFLVAGFYLSKNAVQLLPTGVATIARIDDAHDGEK
jgi:O-antigen ligase